MVDTRDWLMFGVAVGTFLLGAVVAVIDHLPNKSKKNEKEEKIKGKGKR